jgi:hypothetical protein
MITIHGFSIGIDVVLRHVVGVYIQGPLIVHPLVPELPRASRGLDLPHPWVLQHHFVKVLEV